MPEPIKVYVVTQGVYSDYHIEAVYSTREKAEQWESMRRQKKGYDDDYEIEEYTLDEARPMLVSGVTIDEFGEVLHIPYVSIRSWQGYNPRFLTGGYSRKPGAKELTLDVPTSDKETAYKTANEIRAQIIALGLWGDTDKVREIIK